MSPRSDDATGVEMDVQVERFELAAPFRISRGVKTHADVVAVRLAAGARSSAAEAVPYARYGESVEGVVAELRAVAARARSLEALAREARALRGAGRNALETALFALRNPTVAADGLRGFDARRGAGTLVVDAPSVMAERALRFDFAIAKLKLLGDGDDLARVKGVRDARPELPLWLDANEGFDADSFRGFLGALAEAPELSRAIVLVEQPLPEGTELHDAFAGCPVPVCADESFHTAADAEKLARIGYGAVNVKLDKAGGVALSLDAARAAHERGLEVVVGCMVSTSLSIAAAWTLVRLLRSEGIEPRFFDLDGATFLLRDRSLAGTGWG
jgi:L-alanine-DL-glutamate epimerase-like enolase superfamily enzyme